MSYLTFSLHHCHQHLCLDLSQTFFTWQTDRLTDWTESQHVDKARKTTWRQKLPFIAAGIDLTRPFGGSTRHAVSWKFTWKGFDALALNYVTKPLNLCNPRRVLRSSRQMLPCCQGQNHSIDGTGFLQQHLVDPEFWGHIRVYAYFFFFYWLEFSLNPIRLCFLFVLVCVCVFFFLGLMVLFWFVYVFLYFTNTARCIIAVSYCQLVNLPLIGLRSRAHLKG